MTYKYLTYGAMDGLACMAGKASRMCYLIDMQRVINHENKGLLTEMGGLIDEEKGGMAEEAEDEVEMVGCDAQMIDCQCITWFGSHGGDSEPSILID